MLLDEDPATLIHECAANFNITPDRAAISRLNASLSTLSQMRDHKLSGYRADLSKTIRTLTQRSSQHKVALSNGDNGNTDGSNSRRGCAAGILQLDADKFRIVKQISDLEIETERLQAEVEGLEKMLEDGYTTGAMESGHIDDNDSILLKLKFYRSLGITVEQAQPSSSNSPLTNTAHYSKAVLRNPAKGDVHVINIDPSISSFFYANYFWSKI